MFINRKKEMKMFEKLYKTNKAEMFVMYGRRRVGKTELIKEFIKNKKNIYFMADLNIEKELLKMFCERVLSELSQGLSEVGVSFSSWDGIFKLISQYEGNEKLIIVLDEFQYICTSNNAFPSILQRLWDEHLKDSNIMLVLCGSYISFMENEVLAAKSPLYGRRTAQYMLQPMNFFDIHEFFPQYSNEELISAYSILGGIPAYLNKFDDGFGIIENLKDFVLSPETFLHNEVQFLLMQELKETRNYFAILQHVADGETKLNDIVTKSGLDKGFVSKYLYILQELRIIQREIPVTEKNPLKSKRGLYKIADQYTKFWFKFIFPNRSLIQENGEEYVLNTKVIPRLNEFVSWTFEDICIEYLKSQNMKNELPFIFEKIGRWWDANDEIDIVAIGDECAMLGECKWNENKKVNIGVLNSLKKKVDKIKDITQIKKIYALFSRAGFTDDLISLSKEYDDILLFDLNSIVGKK
jgi:AAA+ ATPase superfamily predicted ATPase